MSHSSLIWCLLACFKATAVHPHALLSVLSII